MNEKFEFKDRLTVDGKTSVTFTRMLDCVIGLVGKFVIVLLIDL